MRYLHPVGTIGQINHKTIWKDIRYKRLWDLEEDTTSWKRSMKAAWKMWEELGFWRQSGTSINQEAEEQDKKFQIRASNRRKGLKEMDMISPEKSGPNILKCIW